MADAELSCLDLVFFECVEAADSINGFVLTPISAQNAFRRYSWLKKAPALNKSGNLRGMVINKNMRTVYKFSKTFGSTLAVVSVMIEMSKEWSRAKEVYRSGKTPSEKVIRISMLGSAAIARSVTSVVPTMVDLTMLSLKGYGDLYSVLSGSPAGTDFGNAAQKEAEWVRVTHSKQWDGENWYNFIETLTD